MEIVNSLRPVKDQQPGNDSGSQEDSSHVLGCPAFARFFRLTVFAFFARRRENFVDGSVCFQTIRIDLETLFSQGINHDRIGGQLSGDGIRFGFGFIGQGPDAETPGRAVARFDALDAVSSKECFSLSGELREPLDFDLALGIDFVLDLLRNTGRFRSRWLRTGAV